MRKEKNAIPVEDKKKVLTAFLLLFPTLIVAVVGSLPGFYAVVIQVLLIIYQGILLKQFIDGYYDVL